MNSQTNCLDLVADAEFPLPTRRSLRTLAVGLIVALPLIATLACSRSPKAVFVTPSGKIEVRLTIARTAEERERGLMFKSSLADGEGMVFLFEDEQPRRFWMKHTFVPLDIVFLDETGRVVDVLENLPVCPSEPCPVYTSRFPSRTALELKAGFAARHGIRTGTKVELFLY
jgi:uncharacterized membrane protein (UPF0127 family)